MNPDDIVRYQSPSWGPSRGRVIRTDGRPGFVLVQDLAPNGAKEWMVEGDETCDADGFVGEEEL